MISQMVRLINITPPPPEHGLVFTHHFDSVWFNGAFRLEAHVAPPVLSLAHYCIIISNTSLQVECFSFFFFLSKWVNSGPESIFIRALESVCALFMKAHCP